MNQKKMLTAGIIICGGLLAAALQVEAGDYLNSSHGSSTDGVDRSSIDAKYSTYSVGNCAHCHEQHASIEGGDPLPAGGPQPYLGFANEQSLCFTCHSAGGPAKSPRKDIQSQYASTFTHADITLTGFHKAGENQPADFTTRHAECTDCHNPHMATAVNNTDPTKGPVIGATGLNPNNGGAGTIPTYTFVTVADSDQQYKVCFKCHSNWAGFGTGTNQALEFNPNNESYHYVEGDKPYTQKIYTTATFNSTYVGIMMPRYAGQPDSVLRTAKMRCSDCHGPGAADGGVNVPEGPHGSTIAYILKVPAGSNYDTWNATVMYKNDAAVIWCFNCHSPNFSGTGYIRSNNGDNLHLKKHDDSFCQDCHLTVPHGQTGSGTANQREHLLKPTTFNDNIDGGSGTTSGAYTETSHNYVTLKCT